MKSKNCETLSDTEIEKRTTELKNKGNAVIDEFLKEEFPMILIISLLSGAALNVLIDLMGAANKTTIALAVGGSVAAVGYKAISASAKNFSYKIDAVLLNSVQEQGQKKELILILINRWKQDVSGILHKNLDGFLVPPLGKSVISIPISKRIIGKTFRGHSSVWEFQLRKQQNR